MRSVKSYPDNYKVEVVIIRWVEDASRRLISQLNEGTMSGVVYDTAVIAAITNNVGESFFPRQVKLLMDMQYPDGHWGANYDYPFDHLLSTSAVLSMMAELGMHKLPKYEQKFHDGLAWMTENQMAAFRSGFPLPAGFEFLYTKFMSVAMSKSTTFDVHYTDLERLRDKKLQMLGDMLYSVYNPLFFSMEGVVDDFLHAHQLSRFTSSNGSLASSPASTSIFLKYRIKKALPKAMRFLMYDALQPDGLFYSFGDFTNYNIGYSIYPFIKADLKVGWEVRNCGLKLLNNWTPHGVSYGNAFPLFDGDDTAVVLLVMDYLGIGDAKSKVDSLLKFETETYFKSYLIERDPALITNTHALEAFLQIPDSGYESQIEKIRKYIDSLGNDFTKNSKYHASSIMQVASIILGVVPSIGEDAYKFVNRLEVLIQQSFTTRIETEELGYSLLALLHAHRHGFAVSSEIIHELYNRLKPLVDVRGNFVRKPMWLSKNLYAPIEVDKSFVLASLYLYNQIYERKKILVKA